MEKEGAEKVPIYTRSSHSSFSPEGRWKQENDEKLKSCEEKHSYEYYQGPVYYDFINSFIVNNNPSCILKKAKNKAIENDNMIIVEDSFIHFETGLNYDLTLYECPIATEFELDKK